MNIPTYLLYFPLGLFLQKIDRKKDISVCFLILLLNLKANFESKTEIIKNILFYAKYVFFYDSEELEIIFEPEKNRMRQFPLLAMMH
jgi:hypothetical protein